MGKVVVPPLHDNLCSICPLPCCPHLATIWTRRWALDGTVKPSTLHKALKGDAPVRGTKRNAVLTSQETKDLIFVAKYKNNLGDPEGRAWLSRQVIFLLKHRAELNRGRRYKRLSNAAKKTLERGKVTDEWAVRFIAHKEITEKNARGLEKRRYDCSTIKNSDVYLSELDGDLKDTGLLTVDAGGKVQVDLDGICTSDESPSVLGEEVRSGAGSKVIAGVGDPTNKRRHDNKKRFSYDPWVTLSGKFLLHHVIADTKELHQGLEPDPDDVYKLDPEGVMLSLQSKAFQDGTTLLSALKQMRRQYDKKFPARKGRWMVWLTDGQSARLDIEVLVWCNKNKVRIVLYPPNTTHIHAPLDKVFKMYHAEHDAALKKTLELLKLANEEAFEMEEAQRAGLQRELDGMGEVARGSLRRVNEDDVHGEAVQARP